MELTNRQAYTVICHINSLFLEHDGLYKDTVDEIWRQWIHYNIDPQSILKVFKALGVQCQRDGGHITVILTA